MFGISNQIAYEGLMVFGTSDQPAFPGRDVWLDIRSATSAGHWIPAEGEELRFCSTLLSPAPGVVSTSSATGTPGAMSRTSRCWLPASPLGYHRRVLRFAGGRRW
jgi:hypothetical protein